MPKAKTSTGAPVEIAEVKGGVLTFTDERAPISLSSEGATSVRINYGSDRVKMLTVTMIGHKPSIAFDGIWSGSDIRVIQRHLRTAYFQYTRDLRRAGAARPNQGGSENA